MVDVPREELVGGVGRWATERLLVGHLRRNPPLIVLYDKVGMN